jgi:phage terminase small subunit
MAKEKIKPFEFEDVTESLTDKQKLFCMMYVGECKFNGSESAKKAGYSENSAKEQASYLLTNPNILSYIELLKKDLGLRIGVTAEMIAQEYASIGFSKIDDFIGNGNIVKDITEITKTNVVQSIKTSITTFDGGEKTETEIKLHDKLKALVNLSKMIGCDGVTKVELESKCVQVISVNKP